jgi:hypothetical protein
MATTPPSPDQRFYQAVNYGFVDGKHKPREAEQAAIQALDAGADPTRTDEQFEPGRVLERAATFGWSRLVETLLERYTLRALDPKGRSVVAAIDWKNPEFIKLALLQDSQWVLEPIPQFGIHNGWHM